MVNFTPINSYSLDYLNIILEEGSEEELYSLEIKVDTLILGMNDRVSEYMKVGDYLFSLGLGVEKHDLSFSVSSLVITEEEEKFKSI